MTDPTDAPAGPPAAGPGYQVLARKWRPQTFADLIGQEALVRTLRNAFERDRIAHAFILTGVRGVGKTTTARIVAKGLNCVGLDGQGGPTVAPCGVCEPCRAIAESRHVDVLEMDAASRTGVGDVREIIESVRYRAASARYKVYIVDEVHMLSTNAFNALLKTLEEPPEHVKFIFATTEIRKVPVTVLSRCQRFDLRRIEPEVLIAHLARIAEAEGAAASPEALALIARAAEGSARDALSLLDQAIAHGAGETGADEVRAMLGLADRGRALDLFEAVMRGDAAGALAEFGDQHAQGADAQAVLRELAEIAHWVSVTKIRPAAAQDPTAGPEARARAAALAGGLGHRALARTWQMLLKALEEVAAAPNAASAAEMALIRLTLVAELPSPEDLVRRLTAENGAGSGGGSSGGGANGPAPATTVAAAPAAATPVGPDAPSPSGAPDGGGARRAEAGRPAEGPPGGGHGGLRLAASGGAVTAGWAASAAAEPRVGAAEPMPPPAPAPRIVPSLASAAPAPEARPCRSDASDPSAEADSAPRPRPVEGDGADRPAAVMPSHEPAAPAADAPSAGAPAPPALAAFRAFDDVVALIRKHRDARLLAEVERYVALADYAPGRIVFAPAPGAPEGLAGELARRLRDWTGVRWQVSADAPEGGPTRLSLRRAEEAALEARLREHPLVAAALAAFPGAALSVAPPPASAAEGPDAEAPPPPEEIDAEDWADWDPVDPWEDG